jgi:hypothetical protein
MYIPFYKYRYGLCLETISCVCIHANIVQTDWSNPILGTSSIENLLELWEQGLSINTEKFYDKLGKDVKYQEYEFIQRNS